MNEFVTRYGDAKRQIGEYFGASEALIHVHAGMIIFVAAALLLRRRMASPWPMLVVAVLAISNEVIDTFGPTPASWTETLVDALNTSLWPLILFLLARRGKTVRTKV